MGEILTNDGLSYRADMGHKTGLRTSFLELILRHHVSLLVSTLNYMKFNFVIKEPYFMLNVAIYLERMYYL
jgi:hypothetical protein